MHISLCKQIINKRKNISKYNLVVYYEIHTLNNKGTNVPIPLGPSSSGHINNIRSEK